MKRISQIFKLTTLETEKIDGKLWKLGKPLIYSTPEGFIHIPKDFITDGASAPWLTWSLCPPMGGYHAEAAVFHDYLYSKDSDDDRIKLTRRKADAYFLDAMLENGTSKFRAYSIFYAVRLSGKGSYKKCYSASKIKD